MARGFTKRADGVAEVHVHINSDLLAKAGEKPAAPSNCQPRSTSVNRPQFHAAVTADNVLELMVYGDIVDSATLSLYEYYGVPTEGFISAATVKKALDEATAATSIRVRINSPGGDAFEGMAIHSLLTGQSKPVETCIDGIAASSASIIAMAGKSRKMGKSAMMMIHDSWTVGIGNARDMRKLADTLDKIDGSIAEAYVSRTGLGADKIRSMMNAETWMSSADCVEMGFATEYQEQPEEAATQAMAMAKGFRVLAKCKNLPAALKPAGKREEEEEGDSSTSCKCECDECMAGECDECTNENCTDENCKDCPMQANAKARMKDEMDMAKARQRLRSRLRKSA